MITQEAVMLRLQQSDLTWIEYSAWVRSVTEGTEVTAAGNYHNRYLEVEVRGEYPALGIPSALATTHSHPVHLTVDRRHYSGPMWLSYDITGNVAGPVEVQLHLTQRGWSVDLSADPPPLLIPTQIPAPIDSPPD